MFPWQQQATGLSVSYWFSLPDAIAADTAGISYQSNAIWSISFTMSSFFLPFLTDLAYDLRIKLL